MGRNTAQLLARALFGPSPAVAPYRGSSSLDEVPEFAQHVLESLRQPLEDGRVIVTRARGTGDFPARFPSAAAIRARVLSARERLRGGPLRTNAELTPRQVRKYCAPPPEAERLLAAAMTKLGLSARGHDRVLRVARTIADLDGSEGLRAEHCAEAIQYHGLDRQWRG